jgi:hypothetical protein
MSPVFSIGTQDKGGLRGLEVGHIRIHKVSLDEGMQ